MANTMGVPPEKLLDILYKKEAAKKAKLEVQRGLQEDDDDQVAVVKEKAKDEEKEEKKTLGADQSQKTVGAEKKKGVELLSGSPKLQRDLSVGTIMSKDTVDTLNGSSMAPPFKFGVQKQYKPLAEFDSRRGERKAANTVLKGSGSQNLSAKKN